MSRLGNRAKSSVAARFVAKFFAHRNFVSNPPGVHTGASWIRKVHEPTGIRDTQQSNIELSSMGLCVWQRDMLSYRNFQH
ncbi:MAG: hypothetical protein ACI9CO_000029 [Candidatus Azotimanducaceae bacterium]|jgi:hypothetical protein